jgi:hypothetical protein
MRLAQRDQRLQQLGDAVHGRGGELCSAMRMDRGRRHVTEHWRVRHPTRHQGVSFGASGGVAVGLESLLEQELRLEQAFESEVVLASR